MQGFRSTNKVKIEERTENKFAQNVLASQNGSIFDMLSVTSSIKSMPGYRKEWHRNAKLTARKSAYNLIKFPWTMMLKLFVTLGLIAIAIILKYIYINEHLQEKMELARIAANSIDQYIHTLSVNFAMLELLNSDNESEIQYGTPLRFYNNKVDTFRSRIITYYDKILANTGGPNYDLMSRLLGADVCEVFKNADAKSQAYQNCDISLAGQAKNSVIFFMRQYLSLLDKFISEWHIAKSYNERLALMAREEYASIIAYASHDQYGTADAMFYHMLLPVSTRLTDRIGELSSHVSLSNVIFSVMTVIFTLTLFRSAYYQFISMQENVWHIIKCVPYHLMQSNLILKNKMKQAFLQQYRFAPF